MEKTQSDIRDQQELFWNNASTGWEKWSDHTMNFLKPMGDAIIAELNLQSTDHVLDVASGTGEPALTIAGLTTKGKVVATDISDKMLEIAKNKAQQNGFKNFETKVCDVCELPFDEDSFDKISCRMGFMFFPDTQIAANEMYRVLKSGSRLATSVWSSHEKNIWVTAIMNIIQRILQLPPPSPGSPSMFRCAAPGFIKTLFQQAGFKSIKELEVYGLAHYRDFNEYWEITNDVSPTMSNVLTKAGPLLAKKIREEAEVFSIQYTNKNGLELPYSAIITSGEK